MARKGYQIHKKIEYELKNKSKTEFKSIELYKSIKEIYFPELDKRKYKKAFYRDLNGLLNSGDVEVIGYETDKNRVQKDSYIDHDNLLLRWSERKTRPEIQIMLNEMGKSDESYRDFRRKFKERFNEMVEWNNRSWENLQNCIFSWPGDQTLRIIQDLHGTDFLCDGTKSDQVHFSDEPLTKRSFPLYLDERNRLCFFNLNYMPYILAKKLEEKLYPYMGREDVKVWFYPCTPKEYEDIWLPPPDPNYTKTELRYRYGDALLGDGFRSLIEDGLGPIKINVGEEWSKEEALYNAGFYQRFFPMEHDPDLAFEYVVDILSTYTSDDVQILNNILAKGLSDEPGSLQVFVEFFKKITSVQYSNRLNNVLGIISEHTETVSYEKYKEVKGDLRRIWQLQQMKDDLSL